MTRAPAAGPAAVLIDLDGTLVDTVDVWRAAYLELADEVGARLAEDFWPSIAGRSMQASLAVFGAAATDAEADTLVGRLVAIATGHLAAGAPAAPAGGPGWSWLPGASELLDLLWSAAPTTGTDAAAGNGPRPATALVTSAWRSFTAPLLTAALAGRPGSFDTVVCGDDVERSKPAPDAYLRAAAQLGVMPHDCLAIEDSPTGVAAAEAAGMVVLAVPHAGPITAGAGRAVRTDLVGLTLDDLTALHARLRSEAAR